MQKVNMTERLKSCSKSEVRGDFVSASDKMIKDTSSRVVSNDQIRYTVTEFSHLWSNVSEGLVYGGKRDV